MYIVHDQTNETTTLKRFSLSVCQSVIQPVYQSAHQLINQLLNGSVSQLLSHVMPQYVSESYFMVNQQAIN